MLYQINTRVALNELSRSLGHAATLDDFPDAELDRLAQLGFEWIWLLSVWQTGDAARLVSRRNPEWRAEFEHTLPDCARPTSAAPASPSAVTPCTTTWAAARRFPGFARACVSVASN